MTTSRDPAGTPVIGIVGWKNSGKTTLAVRLIEEFTRRGLRVASVKHAHHSFRIDDEDTDSARHRRSGSRQVAIVSSKRWALVTETEVDDEPALGDVLAKLAPADIVVVEGYKSAPIKKIEVRRRPSAHPDRMLAPSDPHIMAIASDDPASHNDALPVFQIDDIRSIADFIGGALGLTTAHA